VVCCCLQFYDTWQNWWQFWLRTCASQLSSRCSKLAQSAARSMRSC
jgi:hypothetical protein